jgi:hypothetical protein
MTSTTLLRRSVAGLAGAGVTAALTLVPTGAHAAVHAKYDAEGDAQATFATSGGSCTLTSGNADPVSSGVAFTHGTKHQSVDLDATFTNSLNSADTVRVRGHGDSALTLRKKHNDLTAFDLSVGGSIKITHSVSGSQCEASGAVFGEMSAEFSEHKKGWMTITRTTKKPGSASIYSLVDVTRNKPVAEEIFEGGHSKEVVRALLKPGKYVIEEAEAGIVAGEGNAIFAKTGRRSTVAQTVHISGSFAPLKHH